MKSKEEFKSNTPNGGVKSVVYYFTKDREACDKSDAELIEAVEYDENDKIITRTYLTKETGSTSEK